MTLAALKEDPPPTLFEHWARVQKVEKPFNVLRAMSSEDRAAMAADLGMDWDRVVVEAVDHARYDLGLDLAQPRARDWELLLPEAEACLIIGCDYSGIQARAHSAWRTMNPFLPNFSWRQILESIVSEFRIPCNDWTECGLARAIFEHVAKRAWQTMSPEEQADVEEEIRGAPEFGDALRNAGVGLQGVRLIMSTIFRLAERGEFGTYIWAVKAAGTINRRLGAKLVMARVSKLLARTLRVMNAGLWIWLAADVVGWVFGPSRNRLVPIVVQMHLADIWSALEPLGEVV